MITVSYGTSLIGCKASFIVLLEPFFSANIATTLVIMAKILLPKIISDELSSLRASGLAERKQ